MGYKFGGRQAGTKNKKTLERESLRSRAIGELNRPLGKDFLAEVMVEFRDRAKEQTGPIDRGASRLFDTIPRGPSHKAWRNIASPLAPSMCSLRRRPLSAFHRRLASALRLASQGSRGRFPAHPTPARRRRTGTRPSLLGGPAQRGVSPDL